VSRGRWFW